ncbi:flavin-containing monooxygenase [Nocardia pseudobrasiliensis]|uniref:Cation diffusion facilitator CzcD-associated flavoprotein CzcO n=1 Tax=Nocardia pseudobrasiliensis TaxID=45979 RepID=A0A370I896_9NOCA|nr:NAD(P)/FAD-dependent oxidoreductase [Nocardia pseudobrasiliensis]RDI65594.1 cation diffusion facilitator CzcD-associated flavoprotein CzcO [Nocardia pseudobrasiliensis]
MARDRTPRIVIIGAGVSGIASAITLRRNGFDDFVILEKGFDVGGVWHWNRYPGLTCDVPSQLYQFGFAPKPDWSHIFAPGPEIQRYLAEVAERFGLRSHLRLNSEVVGARFTGSGWRVDTADGDGYDADFVIAATGVLHHPAWPELPGLDEFTGDVLHTARWDDAVPTAGRRIAVIGTGSTGVQVVSALQPNARRLTHFVRSPQWVIWAPMRLPQPALVGALLDRAPRLNRALYQAGMTGARLFTDIVTRPSWRRRAVQEFARLSLRAQVRDPRLREQLTPDYQPLCKRQVLSGSYYRALHARNAELVTAGIEAVTPTGIRTADGRHHEVDLIVFATGFRAHNYMRPMNLTGRDGISIDDAWAKGPRAYRMTAIPGFPNLFTVLGPNSPTGSIPLHHAAEVTARYISAWLERWSAGEFDTVEVTEDATARFGAQVGEALEPTVWNTGCNSWYFTEGGAIDLLPFDRRTMESMLAAPDENDFHLRGSAARG